MNRNNNNRGYLLAFVVTIGLFPVWGLMHRINDTIGPHFSALFALSPHAVVFSRSVLAASYLLLAIPAALLLRRVGYRLGVVFGLAAFSAGAFLLYPAITERDYLFYVAALTVMGAGWALLETSANPLIMAMGSAETAVRRLNFAQAFYPVGLLAGVYVGRWLTFPDAAAPVAQLMHAIVRPYVVLGLIVLMIAFLIENLEFPPLASIRAPKGSSALAEFRALLGRSLVRRGAAALGCAIAAQVVVWGFGRPYIVHALPGVSSDLTWHIIFATWIIYMLGRFAGAALMYRFDPDWLLAVCAGGGAVLSALAALTGGVFGVACLVGISLCISIMFPTIFGSTVHGLGALTKSASGLLVTAAGAGALISPLITELLLEVMSIQHVMILAGFCLTVVLSFAMASQRAHKVCEAAPAGALMP